MKLFFILLPFVLLGAGCSQTTDGALIHAATTRFESPSFSQEQLKFVQKCYWKKLDDWKWNWSCFSQEQSKFAEKIYWGKPDGLEKECPQETTTEISIPENDKVCVFVDIITYCQLSSYPMVSKLYNFRCFSSKDMSQDQIIQKVFSTVEQMKKDKKKAISEYSEREKMAKTIQEAVNK
jgi:hypothetical protein